MNTCKHYIHIDVNNNILHGFSDAFEQPLDSDICINENGGRQFELKGEVNPSLFAKCGVAKYIYVDSEVYKKSQDILDEEIALHNQPTVTEIDKLRADIDYLLMLNGEV